MLSPVEWKGSKLYPHTCKVEVTLGFVLTSCILPLAVSLWTGVRTRSMALPLEGGTAYFCELLIAVLMQTPPSFPKGVKKKRGSEFGAEQTGVQILSLLLTSSVIL